MTNGVAFGGDAGFPDNKDRRRACAGLLLSEFANLAKKVEGGEPFLCGELPCLENLIPMPN